MKRSNPSSEQVDISSDEEDEGPVSKKSCSDATFDQPPNEVEGTVSPVFVDINQASLSPNLKNSRRKITAC